MRNKKTRFNDVFDKIRIQTTKTSHEPTQQATENASKHCSQQSDCNGFGTVFYLCSVKVHCRKVEDRFTASHDDRRRPCNVAVCTVGGVDVVQECK